MFVVIVVLSVAVMAWSSSKFDATTAGVAAVEAIAAAIAAAIATVVTAIIFSIFYTKKG